MSFDLVARLRLQDDFTSRMNKVTGQLDRASKGVSNFTKQVGGIAGAIGVTALVAGGFNAVRNSIDSAVSRYDTLNNFPRIMEQVGFSTNESSEAINRLSDGITGLPTKLDDVTGTAQRIAVMTKDLDGAVDTTLALNNAFIASGSDANNAARGLEQYVQLLSKGEVDLQSWRTLQETMGLALNDVAESFGYAGASAQNDLYDALQSGKITFDDFNARLIELSEGTGGFADRALTASGGIKTAWTNMGTSISRGVANVIKAIDEALGGTGSIEGLIGKMRAGIDKAFGFIVDLIPKVVGVFKSVYDTLEPWFPLIKQIANGFMIAVGAIGAFMGIVGEMKPGIATLIGIFTSVKDTAINIFSTLLEVAQPIFSNLGNVFRMLADVAMMVFNNVIVPAISLLWSSFQTAWAIIGPILSLLGAAIEVAFAVLKVVWDTILKPVAAYLLGQFAEALNSVKPILDVIGGAFDWLGDKISGVVSWLKSVAEWFKNISVPDWVSNIGSAVGNFFGGGGKQTSNSHYHGIDYVPKDGYCIAA